MMRLGVAGPEPHSSFLGRRQVFATDLRGFPRIMQKRRCSVGLSDVEGCCQYGAIANLAAARAHFAA
jgi:hypothetical protein